MSIFVLGINHKTAPIALREQLAFASDQIPEALADLSGRVGLSESVLVSTCNRTELWGVGDDAGPARGWLAERRALPHVALDECAYQWHGDEAVRHLFRVACGLDSVVLGEPQILGQLKAAHRAAVEAGTAGGLLGRAFQQAFGVAKQVRTDTGIGTSPVSVAFAAVTLARQIFSNFERHGALLVGAGDTIELTARHLRAHGIGRLTIANRSIDRAVALAQRFDASAIGIEALDAHLSDADVIVCATASPTPVIRRPQMERALSTRRHRPVFIADIAVPRDVEASVGELDDVFLYTVDDLQGVIDESLRSRREAASEAEQIIDLAVSQFARLLRVRDAVDVIRGLRTHAERTRDDTLDEAARRLARGDDPHAVLRWVGHTLTNRLMHDPTMRARAAGFAGDDTALAAARRMLGIDDES